MSNKKLDFHSINNAAVANIYIVIAHLGLQGRTQGNWFTALNPKRDDKKPGSFVINLRTGKWKDYALADAYGDLIALVAYIKDYSQKHAAEELARILGV
ncbi:MAG: hypothetical protein EB060_03215 [Proteobacteria bacterium]|nr:hypothetical protein [Pseudomonadota bacterium]